MIRNKQLIVDPETGDCMRACITSMLDLPNCDYYPNIDDPEWFLKWHRLLKKWGMGWKTETRAMWRDGYWMASVPSINFAEGRHAIVMRGHEVWHDPSTRKQYEHESLLGSDKVSQCTFIEVEDASLLGVYLKHKDDIWKQYGNSN